MFSRIFEEISLSNHEGSNDIELLNQLVEVIRSDEETPKGKYIDHERSILRLIEFLTRSPKLAENFHQFIIEVISDTDQIGLFVDSGISETKGLLSAISNRIGEKLLPPTRSNKVLGDLIDEVFDSDEDVAWLGAIKEEQWVELLSLLEAPKASKVDISQHYSLLRHKVTKALSIVAYRITGLSLDSELVAAYQLLREHESPFIALNEEIQDFIKGYHQYFIQKGDKSRVYPDEDHIYVMVEQCQKVIGTIKRDARKKGITISLTNTLLHLEQNIERLLNLLDLVNIDKSIRYKAIGQLLYTITDFTHNKKRIRSIIKSNTELLSRQVTENASKVGEQYISTDAKGYWSMYRKAAGAGFIIAFLATFKIILSKFVLAPLGRAFFNSMNYGLGFVYIHVMHWKIATKQPAMTAASLASTIDNDEVNKNIKLTELSQMTVDIMRTQFIAIIGNISIAMPTAYFICLVWDSVFGAAMMTTTKANELLYDLDPLRSLSLFHAAIAGVCLFLSGLVAGYYDNKAVYRNVGPRLRQHSGLKKLFGMERLKKISIYLENNLGAIAGNFWFGVMLGSMGTAGYVLGLPLDIRHIAFSSANFIQGIVYTEELHSLFFLMYIFIGVLLIGLVNLLVSFSLALIVALRSRRIQYSHWKALFELVSFHLLTKPLDFFWPAKEKSLNVEK